MNALKPSRELSIEETLTLTFDLYSKNFTLFFIPALIAGAAEGAIGVLVRDFLSELLRTGLGGAGSSGLTWFWSTLTPLLAISAVYVLVVCVISVLALGICVNLASERMEGKKPSLKGALVLTLDKLAPLAVVTIAVGVVVAFGLILLLVPGMIFAVMFSLVIPVIVIENAGASDSLSHSRNLVKGRWLNTFLVFFLLLLVVGFVSFVGSLISTPLGAFYWPASVIMSALTAPPVPILMTVHYYSMQTRKPLQVPEPPF